MKFLVDAQLPPALAVWLRSQGHEADHIFDIGSTKMKDFQLWEFAARSNAVIVSKDEDFAEMSKRIEGPQVIWLRVGNSTNRALLEWAPPRWPASEASIP